MQKHWPAIRIWWHGNQLNQLNHGNQTIGRGSQKKRPAPDIPDPGWVLWTQTTSSRGRGGSDTGFFFWGGGCKRSASASESPSVPLYCSSAQVFFDLNALSFLVPAPITISKYISSSIRRNKLHIVIGYSKMQNRIILFVFHAQEVWSHIYIIE